MIGRRPPQENFKYMEVDQFIEEVKKVNASVRTGLLRKAFEYADRAHKDQMRASGEKYFTHSINVALILAAQKLDTTTIAAGLLHDVVEDTDVTVKDLRRDFGDEIAELVDGVSRISTYQAKTSIETKAEYFRKMLLSMAKDIRVILIKLADRLHNMRTLEYLSEKRQIKNAKETYEVFAPIAHRLGMALIKRELEDLSLKYLHPEEYQYIKNRLDNTLQARESYVKDIIGPLQKELKANNVAAEVYGRAKSIDSIHRKMTRKERSFEEIYDLFAIRIIVDSVAACYHALGVVHMLYVPVGGFDDYIAKPKQNGYQSLHTNVIGPDGHVLEFQIRTREMHMRAEYGIASHWLYKEGARGIGEADKRLNWLREVLDWQKDMTNPAEFLEYLKIDLYHDEVFVFTPRGELKHLPSGSTALDFAFAVHTEVGLHCAGARINGKLVPLNTELRSGDEVEVMTATNKQPSRDWLKMVNTSGARSKIRKFIKQQDFEKNRQMGKEMLERHLRKMRLPYPSNKEILECAESFSYKNVKSFLAALGQGDVSVISAVNRLYPQALEESKESIEDIITDRTRFRGGIKIDDIKSLQFNFGRCCQPVPGEDVVGFITRGRGVTVHRRDCPNIQRANIDKARIVELDWDISEQSKFVVKINLIMEDRKNILRDILNSIADDETNLKNSSISASRGLARGEFIAEVRNLTHLNRILDQIKKVKGVIDVTRSMGSSKK
ncbi:MAG TPA: bifunctional (p)ppGpp synthetase/guanosine-3',5'-bis(diphosphate) 3'-pyrophosphohydrolase [candidate division Zixibacteria bacterium]|nr:bifunctional (p)ppGpp synthetase/guanosine-3',5'-bis(diphosphate) 3'-pyrophosphohydrolase [candidate division Zixibacteria bacterium]